MGLRGLLAGAEGITHWVTGDLARFASRSNAFLPKASARGLQAADRLAYENFKHVTTQFVNEGPRPVRKLFAALENSRLLSLGYYNEAALEYVHRRLREVEARLVRATPERLTAIGDGRPDDFEHRLHGARQHLADEEHRSRQRPQTGGLWAGDL